MIDFIYTVFIAPLEYWMRVVLVWGHGVCDGNWGWAIVLMSLVVNTVILPIYMKAESWQEQEQKLRLGFEAKEAMIKRAFHGQERFAMISTMRRQAGYTAFLSMRSSVGFFLQIPFFFAAYHFLSHFDPLSGVSFLGLADLGKPDEALHIGSFAVNVMPILMTVINIGSALIYTKHLARRDKIQLYAMAALFLVLLYDAASGLVLYWTCNNIYSLAKNVVYDVVRKVSPAFKTERFRAFFAVKRQTTVNEAISFWLCISGGGLWFLGALLGSLSSGQATFLSEQSRVVLTHTANTVFLVAAFIGTFLAAKARLYRRHWVFCLLVLVGLFFTVKFWYKGEFVSMARHGATLVLALLSLIPAVGTSAVLLNLAQRICPKVSLEGLYDLSTAWLVILIAGYLPIHAFNTAPETFSALPVILAHLLLLVGVLLGSTWLLGKVFAFFRIRKAMTLLFVAVSLYFTVYAFLLPLDAGTIDGFQLSKPTALFRAVNLAVDSAVFLLLGLLLIWVFRKGYVSVLKTVFTFCIVMAFGASLCELWTTKSQWDLPSDSVKEAKAPAWNNRFLGFSKTGHNTVVLILDMFSGFHVQTILENNPDVALAWKDATWYADCLATGPSTQASLASIICGKACTPEALNEKPDESLITKINRSYADVANRFGSDVDVTINERNWLEPQLVSQYAENNPLTLRYMPLFYLSHYMAKRGMKHEATSGEGFLVSVSLFSSAPWSLKNYIYNGGSWTGSTQGHNASLATGRLRDWAFLESFPELANADARKSTFKVIYSELTHWPWFMKPGSCDICAKGYPLTDGQRINPGHLQTETCALRSVGKWFAWMKENGVYDNTTVILASDHGHGVGRKSALLLVKPAGSHQRSVRRKRAPVELADVAEMIFGRYPKDDPSRERTFRTVGARMATTFRDVTTYRVKGPVMDPKSWPNGRAYGE